MKIYKLDFDVNNYKSIQVSSKVDADYYQLFDGNSIKDIWQPLSVSYYEEDSELKEGDAPGFNIPVVNKRALDVLYPLIKGDIEILPLQLGNEQLYGINVLTVADVLDYDLSEYKTYRDGKRIMAVKKYVFKEEKIKNDIFKIIDLPRGAIFVSDQFCKLVKDNNLEGFKFELVCE